MIMSVKLISFATVPRLVSSQRYTWCQGWGKMSQMVNQKIRILWFLMLSYFILCQIYIMLCCCKVLTLL